VVYIDLVYYFPDVNLWGKIDVKLLFCGTLVDVLNMDVDFLTSRDPFH
jgi:hypothetical protein